MAAARDVCTAVCVCVVCVDGLPEEGADAGSEAERRADDPGREVLRAAAVTGAAGALSCRCVVRLTSV